MAATLAVIAVVCALNVVVTFGFIHQQETDGIVINVAGRQRMLSQKMSKEAFAIAAGNEQLRTTLKETASEFEGSLRHLLEGNAERSLPAAQGEVKTQLEQVIALWSPFSQQVQVIQTASVASPEFEAALAYIAENSAPLLDQMDSTVGLYEEQFSGKVNLLKWVVVGLAVVGALVAAVAWWLVFAGLARPLAKLSESAVRFGRGELHHRVDVDTASEVGTVAREFNAMANQLGEMHETLELANAELQESEAKFRVMAEAGTAATFIWQGTNLRYVNPAAEAMTGYSGEELLAMNFWDLIHPDYRKQAKERRLARHRSEDVPSAHEFMLLTKDGQERWVKFASGSVEFDGQPAAIGAALDITDRKQAEEAQAIGKQELEIHAREIEYINNHLAETQAALERTLESERERARRDPLTSVLNHGAIVEELRELVSSRDEEGSHVVAMVDVDGLKAVNDTFGHQAGDQVLIEAANALSVEDAIVGRYGGDEFIVILRDANPEQAERYRAEVIAGLRSRSVSDPDSGATVPVTVSIGFSTFPDDAGSVEDIIETSDAAMYAAKRQRPLITNGVGTTPVMGEEQASRMIGQIVPLLTTPGDLDEKLRRAAQRLSAIAGYDGVDFTFFAPDAGAPLSQETFANIDGQLLEAWIDEQRSDGKEPHPMRALLERSQRPVIIDDMEVDERLTEPQRKVLVAAGIRSGLVVPMIWHGRVIGATSVGSKQLAAFSARDAQYLSTVATQITAIMQMETVVDELQTATLNLGRAHEDTVLLLAAAAEAHDRTTGLHLQGVRELTESLARELGSDEEAAQALGLASILHDIGKMRVPDSILASPGQLTGERWNVMKQHTTWGAEFLSGHAGFELATAIAAHHHEQWDGTGYPHGLSGDDIPEPALIVAVADAFDAITHDRPYRAARTPDEAVGEISNYAGKQFSPQVVAALQRLHERAAPPHFHSDASESIAA